MSTAPPPWDPAQDPDEQYRRVSALDPSRPSEATRHAVLSHAARLAAGRARADARRRWLSFAGITSGWRPALTGTLAAAVLAGFLIVPQLLTPRPSPPSELLAPAPAPAPPAEAVRPAVGVHPARAAPPSARASAAQEISVTAARRAQPEPAPMAQAAPPAAADAATNRLADAGVARGYTARAAPTPALVSFDPEVLRRAAGAGDTAALDAQLAAAGDLEARDVQGRTALMLATLHGRAGAVTLLLAHGADANAADEHGTTPLAAAIAANEPEIAATLRRYGAR